ncbi:hypothetical protein T10_6660 [Trichinella papuae]|uniref:Uncharacterized protein n=1 Tax=Trichinella papuae TaxID=268474 RepID=A0A0V1M678_9BILA|nr:hypothetical protein T10_6660 [Trichinella papuae]
MFKFLTELGTDSMPKKLFVQPILHREVDMYVVVFMAWNPHHIRKTRKTDYPITDYLKSFWPAGCNALKSTYDPLHMNS